MCNVGFDLFTENGVSNYRIPESETGLRDGDTFRVNKTCVRKMCPALEPPQNGRLTTGLDTYRFGDILGFACDFGYVLEGGPALLCTSSGDWNGTIPTCNRKLIRPNRSGLDVHSGSSDHPFGTCLLLQLRHVLPSATTPRRASPS